MTDDVASLVSENLDIWTTAVERKSGAGRGGGKRINLYGIDRLRALIFDLGVRGKLVPQDSNDESAADLLKRIKKAKAQRVLAGEMRKPRELDNGHDLKAPFSIPDTWQWVRLDDVGAIVGGGTPPAGNASNFVDGGQGVPWLTPADLGRYKERYISHGERDLTEAALKASSATVMPTGSVLFTSRAPIGYVVIAANPISTNQGFKSIVPYIAECSLFIATAMKSFAKAINDNAPGTTFKEVSGKMVAALPLPLPPLAEQQRIVVKVDELMALCDALEAESAAAMAAHQALVEALLATLTTSTDAADLAANWARLEEHFDTLFTTEASVDALKQTILELAVRGKLVSQESDEETAAGLLKKIENEISTYCTENRIAKPRPEPIDSSKLQFPAPKGWAWSRLSGLFKVITDGDHQPPPKADDGVAFLTIGNVTTGTLDFSGCRTVPEEYYQSLAKYRTPTRGDILYTVVGATYGRPAIVDTDRQFCVQRHIAILKPSEQMNLRYLAFLLGSPLVYRQASDGITGTAQPTVALRPLRNFLVPVPPLSEQARIVARIDELMALCDALSVAFDAVGETQKHLADSIVERSAV